MKKIVLIGAGGHCKVIIDIIKSTNEYEIVGITDKNLEINNVLNIPILGDDRKLSEIHDSGVDDAFVCIGALNNMYSRSKMYEKLKAIGFKIPVLIHKNSVVSKFAHIEDGTCIMPGVVINAGTNIGGNCIINTGSIIEHDCNISYNTHISPKVCLGGGVNIGMNSHIGIGSCIIQGINIGNNVTIGAGAVVVEDIGRNALAVGIPAKVIRIKENI